jgi:hypothetical protein
VKAWGIVLAACLAFAGVARAAGEPEGVLQVLGVEGNLRLLRFETEPWPIEAGVALPDNSCVELDASALLRLRYFTYLDFTLAGPARMTVYVVPSPLGGEDDDRVILKLDAGALFVDGRFRFGRPADVVLSLPDRSLPLPEGRFFVSVAQGRTSFYAPLSSSSLCAVPALLSGTALVAVTAPAQAKAPVPAPAPLPEALLKELDRPVKLFVVARDYDQDLGTWPHPAVLGPLLAERMAGLQGVSVVDGSGDTYFAYRANAALKSGQDFFLKELARAQGARWVMVGNCVVDTPPQESAPGRRFVRGQAEVRLLEADGESDALELVSEAAVTRVARAGRPEEQASREAFEAASDEVARYVGWQVSNLLKGLPHAQLLIKLSAEGVDMDAYEALRARLSTLDSVQRFYRRSFSKGTAVFDLQLRKDAAEFDAQWAAAPPTQGWTFTPEAADAPDSRRVRAEKGP